MRTKSEIYNTIMDKVCEICEIRRSSVTGGSRIQAVVDARILCVQYLRRAGMSFEEIALYMARDNSGDSLLCPPISELRKKSKGYRKMFCNYTLRCLDSKIFRILSTNINSELSDILSSN